MTYQTPTPSNGGPVQPKVAAATTAAAIATILVLVLGLVGVPVPLGVEGAIATIVAFVAGYFKRN